MRRRRGGASSKEMYDRNCASPSMARPGTWKAARAAEASAMNCSRIISCAAEQVSMAMRTCGRGQDRSRAGWSPAAAAARGRDAKSGSKNASKREPGVAQSYARQRCTRREPFCTKRRKLF